MIEWSALKSRLAAAEQALSSNVAVEEDRLKAALASRAERLACRQKNLSGNQQLQPALVVRVGGERFAIPVGMLAEILPAQQVIPVPGAPREIRGVINVHGEIFAVADASQFLSGKPAAGEGRVVMLRHSEACVGLFVSAVEQIEELDFSRFVASADFSGSGTYTRGITAEGLSLLDGAALLSHSALWGSAT